MRRNCGVFLNIFRWMKNEGKKYEFNNKIIKMCKNDKIQMMMFFILMLRIREKKFTILRRFNKKNKII
jgi:hypothetical protein